MDETPRPEPAAPGGRPSRQRRGKGLLWSALAVVLAFLLGFGWQWYGARSVRDRLASTEAELRVERLRVQLAQAAIAAQTGDYEDARARMSLFFTRLQDQVDSVPAPLARSGREILDRRDDVITGLSRANPEYAGILYGMLVRFEGAAAGPAAGQPRPAAPEPGPAAPDSPAAADTPGAMEGEREGEGGG